MNYHPSHHRDSGGGLIAFVAGVATTLALGGYFLFGPKGKENRREIDRWVKKTTGEILERIENIEEVTEDQYRTIVDEVTYRQAKLEGMGDRALGRLRGYFKSRWDEMKNAAKEARKEAEREVKSEESYLELSPDRERDLRDEDFRP
jgi:hypothetical protein